MLTMRAALIMFFGLSAAIPTHGQSVAGEGVAPNGGKVLIAFNDRSVFRRTPEDAPEMGSGREDFRVQIACYDFSDCKARIPGLYAILATRHVSSQECARAYARISVLGDDYGSGETSEVFDVDFAGTCVVFGGRHFKLRKSIFNILGRPLKVW
jgi:hypothetical protein